MYELARTFVSESGVLLTSRKDVPMAQIRPLWAVPSEHLLNP